MLSFSKEEKRIIKKLNTPPKIQDFLNSLKFNFENKGETFNSPIIVLRTKRAHCIEGAVLGSFLLNTHGFKSYLLHLKTKKGDFDHVIVPFKWGNKWGALSKTNHNVLRYREPVYKSIRELVMSYFHEYFLDNGEKTLRSYSRLLNLNVFEKGWEREVADLWGIDEELDRIKHFNILDKFSLRKLRKADKIEIKAGKIVDFKK